MKRGGRLIVGALVAAGAVGAGINLGTERAPEPAETASQLRLVLNVPAYRLDVYENGRKTRSYEVAVGSPRHATPRGSYRVSKVVWNPWWHPPSSGWARGEKPTPPGPRNPMGRVKLYFRNLYYIHGTNQPGSLGEPASHGCVRMRNADAIELARLVHQYASPDLSEREMDRLVDNERATRTVWLKAAVPLEIAYQRVEVHDGDLKIHRDVYRAAGAVTKQDVTAVLAKQGVSRDEIDDVALNDVVRLARTTRISVPVETLLRSGAVAAADDDR